MCPELVTIGPFTIYSYGLMLATGFLVANCFLSAELKRRALDPRLGLPERINHARIGEAILLGRETTHRKAWPGTYQDQGC